MALEIEVFTSTRCPSCAAAAETVKGVADELDESVTWRRRDVVEHIDRAVALGVRATPAIVVGGELVATGVPSVEALRKAVRARLAAAD